MRVSVSSPLLSPPLPLVIARCSCRPSSALQAAYVLRRQRHFEVSEVAGLLTEQRNVGCLRPPVVRLPASDATVRFESQAPTAGVMLSSPRPRA